MTIIKDKKLNVYFICTFKQINSTSELKKKKIKKD